MTELLGIIKKKKMLQQAIMNTFETNEKIESLNKQIGDIKYNQIEILELKIQSLK